MIEFVIITEVVWGSDPKLIKTSVTRNNVWVHDAVHKEVDERNYTLIFNRPIISIDGSHNFDKIVHEYNAYEDMYYADFMIGEERVGEYKCTGTTYGNVLVSTYMRNEE